MATGRGAGREVPVGLAVAVGGGLGAILRFTVSGWVTSWAAAPFPWGTLAVNVAGSLALGAFSGVLARRDGSAAARGFLLTGLCGGFTTFSAFGFETLALLERGAFAAAAGYVAASVGACVAGVWVGLRSGRGLAPAHRERDASDP